MFLTTSTYIFYGIAKTKVKVLCFNKINNFNAAITIMSRMIYRVIIRYFFFSFFFNYFGDIFCIFLAHLVHIKTSILIFYYFFLFICGFYVWVYFITNLRNTSISNISFWKIHRRFFINIYFFLNRRFWIFNIFNFFL